MKAEVIDGVRQYPIKLWLDTLLEHGAISDHEHSTILADDTRKFEKLISISKVLKISVQKFTVIPGTKFSKKSVREKVATLGTHVYDIRMVPDPDSNSKAFRIHGLSFEDAVHYIRVRLHAPECYTIYLSEHYTPFYSGTIISNAGSLLIELVKGQHLHLTQAGTKVIYRGYWDIYRMSYNHCDRSIRRLIWNAAKMIIVSPKDEISPLNRPFFFEGYFEFIYEKENKFILKDYSRHPFFTSEVQRDIIKTRGAKT